MSILLAVSIMLIGIPLYLYIHSPIGALACGAAGLIIFIVIFLKPEKPKPEH
jgi:hypothetical protein